MSLGGEGWVINSFHDYIFFKTTRTQENLEASLPRRKKKGNLERRNTGTGRRLKKKFYIHSRNFYLDLRFGLKKKGKKQLKIKPKQTRFLLQGRRNDLNQKVNTLTHTHATNNISPPPLSKFEFFPVLQQDPIQKKSQT
jgi:hypothetical protein